MTDADRQTDLLLFDAALQIGGRSRWPWTDFSFDDTRSVWQFAVMVKTQIQIPDALFREAKRLAAENEMSFAEIVRRGLEEIIRHHPPSRTRAEKWVLPPPHNLGEALVPEDQWTNLCHE